MFEKKVLSAPRETPSENSTAYSDICPTKLLSFRYCGNLRKNDIRAESITAMKKVIFNNTEISYFYYII